MLCSVLRKRMPRESTEWPLPESLLLLWQHEQQYLAASDAEAAMHEDCQDVAAAAQRFVGHSLRSTTNDHGTVVEAPE